MPITHLDRNRNEGSGSLKVTTKVKSNLNASLSPAEVPRKKRVPGACDICKRKKVRCDSGEMPDNKCSNCLQFGYECTHKEVTKHLGPARGYVEGLEQRLERMEKLLNKVLPGVDINQDVDVAATVNLPRNDTHDMDPLAQQIAKLQINPTQNRFFGRSSTFHLVQTALDIRSEFTGSTKRFQPRRQAFWTGPSRFRTISLEKTDPAPYKYPEPELLKDLADLYFQQWNLFFPLLHRATFERGIAEDLHLKDREFGSVVLLVCALGAKFSNDPRVFSDVSGVKGDYESEAAKLDALDGSCGWKWFEQVELLRTDLQRKPTLYELQAYALSILFGYSTEEPHGTWTQSGIAMRMALDVGAHRKRTKYDSKAEDELWKRAFWVLAGIDRSMSAFSGKPQCLQVEDIDVDLPAECDDEYWDHPDPERQFQQPAGKPSIMAYFTCYMNLMDILAWATRAIYSLGKPKGCRYAALKHSEQQSLSELDSAMNSWMGALPEHLRWNVSQENPDFLAQSATLHAVYYQIQIFIHRPFIPSPRNPTPSIYPSLAICTNAARSCCHVLETHSQTKRSLPPYAHILMPIFTSAVILLLNIWSGKRSGANMYPRREFEDVQKCIDMLQGWEKRWPMSGRLAEVLSELASVGDIAGGFCPLSSATGPASSSTSRSSEGQPQSESSPGSSTLSQQTSPLQSAGTPDSSVPSPDSSLPLAEPPPPRSLPTPATQVLANFALPFYSNELGRLPIFGQFNFSDAPTHTNPLRFSQQTPFGPSPFAMGSNDNLPSANSNSSPTPSAFVSPALPNGTASSLSAATSSLPINSLPHPIQIAQLNPNPQIAGGSTPFVTQKQSSLQSDAFPLGNLYAYQASSSTAEDGLVAAQLMAQFSGRDHLAGLNNSGPNGLGQLMTPLLNNEGNPGQQVSEQMAQLQRDILYSTNQMMVDEDVMAMWSSAPNGFELDDWGTYITSMDQIMRDQTLM